MTLGTRGDSGGSFVALSAVSPELELVSGFQGGYHLEMALLLKGIEETAFETTISYRVLDPETGSQWNQPTSYSTPAEFGWVSHRGGPGWVHYSRRVILEVDRPDEVVGEAVRLVIRVTFRGSDRVLKETRRVTIVDRVNELGR